jgi:CspA family cold shock protein
MSRASGTVKWFSKEKGFGFITQEDGPDVFVHHTAIEGSGFRALEEGDRVEFDVVEDPKGQKAQNVTRIEE